MITVEDETPTFLTLAELRKARVAKYDILVKNLYSLSNSTFRTILGLPPGQLLKEEFPGLEFRRADSMLYADETIYHIEFQSKNHPTMPARMHEYAFLINKYKDHFGIGKVSRLLQSVVYLGPGLNTMVSPFVRWGTTHVFESFNITSKFDAEIFRRLIGSRYLYDWIVALLIHPKAGFFEEHVVSAAKKMTERYGAHDPEVINAKVMLLLACLMRKISSDTIKEVEDMLRVNVNDSNMPRQIYDDGANETAILEFLEAIEEGLAELDITLNLPQREYVATFDFAKLRWLNKLAIRHDFKAIGELVTPPEPSLTM
ncbi:hypothetical protein [Shinella sp.]|uniref:hypothetical protein n=1 Tax=Shinella sp. TaxID=1870904 RepID=UPI0028A1D117|nr:hypothetical protein [Shinella sp.]